MENRRLLFATLLSALVLMVWYTFIAPPPPPVKEPPADLEPPAATSPAAPSPDAGTPSAGPAAEPAAEAAGEEEEAAPSLIDFGAEKVAASTEETVVLETDRERAEFTNRGAQLVSFQLKEHDDTEGKPVELVRPRGLDPYPFALVVGGESHRLNNALFEAGREKDEDGFEVLRFRHKSERGAAEKVFRFTPEGLLAAEVTVEGSRDWGLLLGPGVRRLEKEEDPNSRWLMRQAAWRHGGKSETARPGSEEEDLFVAAQGLRWVALEDNYFLNAAMPRSGVSHSVIRPVRQRAMQGPYFPAEEPRFLLSGVEVDEEDLADEFLVLLQASDYRMEILSFLGAKQYQRLAALPYGLEETVRWGSFLQYLARPLYYCLEWIHERMIANYGWAIVLTTILIKLLLFPLTHKSQMSMQKMQELNPKVQSIRAKYKGKLKDKKGRPNPESQRALNDEIMAVYKTAGVNPMGGCFPILLQMPVFFAFYRLLSTAVELRGAPWISWWVDDLTQTDIALPILMGLTSVAMQKMMPQPAAGDPMQQRLMQMMPIMFAVFAFTFPSGLVLYWVTNNVLSMIQQQIMMKLKGSKEKAQKKKVQGKPAKKASSQA